MEKIKRGLKSFGLPRIIILLFFVFLCVMAIVRDLNFPSLLSNVIARMPMDGVLVLAMVPGILCGIGLNFGVSIGIIAGLLGMTISMEMGATGLVGFAVAILISTVFSSLFGYGYGAALNRMKGSEMTVSTYVGFSVVALMCMGWALLPFKNNNMVYAMGAGLRPTIALDGYYNKILDDFGVFTVGGITIPTGSILFLLGMCFLVWLFLRSKTGIAMRAAGQNPLFAEASGISVNKMRIVGTVLSTVIGGIGIIVYSQSYGFMQLYNAPRLMAFSAIAAVLIGGASANKASISNVLLGVFLFQGILVLGLPVVNDVFQVQNLSEIMRIIITNGIIIYALTRVKGGTSRG